MHWQRSSRWQQLQSQEEDTDRDNKLFKLSRLKIRDYSRIFLFLQNSYRWVGMPDISNVQKSFLKAKTEKGRGNNKRKGAPVDKRMKFTFLPIRYRNIFENVLKSGNERRMDLAFRALF